ncbi:defensin-like protein 182 [Pistacia vera]|uniref:defensin-like protein 182 n=1 Tax=Pistacia vera TaxID=55513 RepID=UPI001263E425|nr:defensin-like protein 182 [Pistacia vera]
MGKLFSAIQGEICTEDLGSCDDTCNSKCASKHPNGKGFCDSSSHLCKCYYEYCTAPPSSFPPPPPPPPPTPPNQKTCTAGIGRCSAACNDACCNENCAAKYPGPYGGHGICFNALGPSIYNMCLCIFDCSNLRKI